MSMAASGISRLRKKAPLRRWSGKAAIGVGLAAILAPALTLSLLSGCAAGPAAKAGAGSTQSKAKTAKAPKQGGVGKSAGAASGADQSGGFAAVSDWEAFARTRRSLGADIEQRAKALREGPVGDRGAQLASLRMTAKAPALIDKGSLAGALELLERAVSIDGTNGYAYLFLAYVHHVQGQSARASEFLSSARRYLPADPGVRGEVEGLARSIRQSGPRAAAASRSALG